MTSKTKESRVLKAKKLLDLLEKTDKSTILIFSDKKMWTVDEATGNKWCVVQKGEEAIPINQTKHPAGVMMLGVVGSDGQKMPPYFFKCGLKIGGPEYRWVLGHIVIPWIKATYPDKKVMFQQDSAPGHAANDTQKYLAKNLPGFIPKELWPPSSPDANPLDYFVWGYLKPKVCATSHSTVDSLKTAIVREWDAMPSEMLVKACNSFRGRLEAIVQSEGGHIEGKRKK